ncbi:hypothetical protein Tco_1451388, partial [Tanacetum coccineum]
LEFEPAEGLISPPPRQQLTWLPRRQVGLSRLTWQGHVQVAVTRYCSSEGSVRGSEFRGSVRGSEFRRVSTRFRVYKVASQSQAATWLK